MWHASRPLSYRPRPPPQNINMMPKTMTSPRRLYNPTACPVMNLTMQMENPTSANTDETSIVVSSGAPPRRLPMNTAMAATITATR